MDCFKLPYLGYLTNQIAASVGDKGSDILHGKISGQKNLKYCINKICPCQEGCAPFYPFYPLGKASAFVKPRNCLRLQHEHFLGFTQKHWTWT